MFVIVNTIVVAVSLLEKQFLIVESVKRAPARRTATLLGCIIWMIFVTGIITARPVSRPEVFLVLSKTKIFYSSFKIDMKVDCGKNQHADNCGSCKGRDGFYFSYRGTGEDYCGGECHWLKQAKYCVHTSGST